MCLLDLDVMQIYHLRTAGIQETMTMTIYQQRSLHDSRQLCKKLVHSAFSCISNAAMPLVVPAQRQPYTVEEAGHGWMRLKIWSYRVMQG